MKGCKYKELSAARVQKKRNVVVSECVCGETFAGFTLAQQLIVDEYGAQTNVFLKNAIHVDTIENLCSLRDAINLAIKKHDKNSKK